MTDQWFPEYTLKRFGNTFRHFAKKKKKQIMSHKHTKWDRINFWKKTLILSLPLRFSRFTLESI